MNGAEALGEYERRLQHAGFDLVAGVDEVGRGALAGPLVAAAVVLPPGFDTVGLRDSKLLSATEREEWSDRILATAVAVAVVSARPDRIDRDGLHVTNLRLLHRAVTSLPVVPDFVLADGFPLRLAVPHLSVKQGDDTCSSVAAASVVAKVARDRTMGRYHRRYPVYGFDAHKGYGTPEHRAALARHGPCPIHRLSFNGVGSTAPARGGEAP